MLVPRTAKGFRATVNALRSLDGSRGVSFLTKICGLRVSETYITPKGPQAVQALSTLWSYAGVLLLHTPVSCLW
jgi:hypothetical protein